MAENEFTEKQEVKQNFIPVGRSGTFITSDVIQNDYLEELIGTPGQEEFAKMLLSDSQIRKLYHAVSNPIKSAKWSIEPGSTDQADLDIAQLMEQIIFKDLPDGWRAKLDEILTFPWHGHAVFEILHANRNHPTLGPYTGLLNIAFRDQRTLGKWRFSPEGILQSIHQAQSGDIEVDADMPADTLLIFYNEKKGNDSGYPFCRMLYGNYKRKLLYKTLQAVGIERAAIPVPHLELPENIEFDSAEYADAVEQLKAFTQAEQAYFVTPAGYKLNYNQTATFDPAKVQVAIKSENEEISGSLIGMWLEMGIGGNSAVGSSTGISSDFFKDGIEYLADKIADAFNDKIIPQMVAMNFPNTPEVMPKLVHAGIADEAGKELMEVVTGYSAQGIITPDEQLEDHVRKVHNLPKKAEGEVVETGTTDDKPEDDNTPDDTPDDTSDTPDDDVELSNKGARTPRTLIVDQAGKISQEINVGLRFAADKYINDVIKKYRQLPQGKKQNATNNIKIGGSAKLRKELKRTLSETANLSIDMARTEIPSKKDIELNDHERDWLRMSIKYDDIGEIKLNEASKLPSHIQVLIAKQADLITNDSLEDLKSSLDFTFSGIELRSSDEAIIKQALEDQADALIGTSRNDTKGTNAASTMVNEGRDSFFFEPEVLEEIHSFTFVNVAPKAAICRELAGTTFNTNDAESLRYSPPLHHNCKSYLRANLKVSKGTDRLNVSTLSPSASAKKSITL